MKSLAPLVGFSLALVAAGLGSGCASSTPTATYHQPAQDFEVVESSTERPLNDTELAEVRSSVASYLDREGVSDSGDYFLKVYLTPENVDADSEWVVVRFTHCTDQRVAVVSSYPYDSLMYSSYYPYYAYDVYPYGYGCVARISFQYYVDPFYHQRYYYYPRHGHGGHQGDHHDTANNNHGGKPNHPGDHNGPGNNAGPNRPSGSRYPGNRSPSTSVTQQNTDATTPGAGQPRNQWRGRPGVDARPSGTANTGNRPGTPSRVNNPDTPVVQQDSAATTTGAGQPRDNSRDQWRGRGAGDSGASNTANTGNRTGAPNRANNTNTRPQGYRPLNSTTASTQNPAGNPPTQRRNDRTNPRPAPSGANNVTRTEAYVPPTQNRQASATSRPTPTPRTTPTPATNRPAPNYSRPAPSVQQSRAPAPSYQQPARSAPPASDGNKSESRQNSNNQREAMR